MKILQKTEVIGTCGVVCDICEKKCLDNEGGEDLMERSEFVHINFKGGYSSVWGDGMRVAVDICQHCFKEKLGKHCRTRQEDPLSLWYGVPSEENF